LSGAYQSSFSSGSYRRKWIDLITPNLVSCETRLQQRHHGVGASQLKILKANKALQLHVEEQLKVFFVGSGGATNYFSIATCYCCLMNVPKHPLPCGHVLALHALKVMEARWNIHW